MLTRRHLLVGTLTAIAVPARAAAQREPKAYHVGILSLGATQPDRPGRPTAYWDPFIEELRALGYEPGRNLTITYAGADARPERLAPLASGFVKAGVDIIVTTGPRETHAAKAATSSIPIVMTLVADPLASGLVATLARPGGNVTGLATLAPGLYGKYVELLHELVPSARRFAIVVGVVSSRTQREELEQSARVLGLTLVTRLLSGVDDFQPALAEVKKAGAGGIIVTSDVLTQTHSKHFVQLTLKNRLPGIYWARQYVDDGGLMAYSANYVELRRRAAHYVDRILKGSKPADLPVEQPTKFELVINAKTASMLGLTIPAPLLARADQVIDD